MIAPANLLEVDIVMSSYAYSLVGKVLEKFKPPVNIGIHSLPDGPEIASYTLAGDIAIKGLRLMMSVKGERNAN